MTLLVIAGVFVTVFLIACGWAFRSGRAEQRAEDEDEKISGAKKAAALRARLAVDDDYAARMRKRFSR